MKTYIGTIVTREIYDFTVEANSLKEAEQLMWAELMCKKPSDVQSDLVDLEEMAHG
jgi:hypothetical protein